MTLDHSKLYLPALLLLFVVFGAMFMALAREDIQQQTVFDRDVKPVLATYCYPCHGNGVGIADLALDEYESTQDIREDRETWTQVNNYLKGHIMPPANKPQPGPTQRDLITGWIERVLYRYDPAKPDPGHVTIRRLNRQEYNNTIRDLFGIDFRPADDFPSDDTGYGFDNIGDVLSLPPVLFEKYLRAADEIMDRAIVTEGSAERGGQHSMSDSLENLFDRHRNRPKGFWLFRPFRRLLGMDPDNAEIARGILTDFTRRAWRRSVTSDELDRLMKLYELAKQEKESFAGRIKLAMKGVLVSPNFIFRSELRDGPDVQQSVQPIDDFALASRLSYFLWSSMPDDELLDLAERQELRQNLKPQVRRMLRSPKARAMVDNFAGQWLQTRKMDSIRPSLEKFRDFDEALRTAMRSETEMFFEYIMREDRSVLEFLDADYTFINGRLAKHYGIPNISRAHFRRVSLEGFPRRGILTQASVLSLTSNPTRTSPVKRGKWVLENLLGTPPPPPPPDVPELDDDSRQLTGTLRDQMVQHRENAMCASCHARMDPVGFGLENFDGIGAWREMDGGHEIDATGELTTGETFDGALGLIRILADSRRDDFLRCLTEKMLTYALGRGLEYYDKPAIDDIVKGLAEHDYRFSQLVEGVVTCYPFQMQRGAESEYAVLE